MKTKMIWEIAFPLAEEIKQELSPYCQRIQIAGSLRRCVPYVGDIEIVAMPIFKRDMFGKEVVENHRLNDYDYSKLGRLVKNGSKFKQIELNEAITLDLFIVTPPAQWGTILLIRTGPEEYSHRFVMPKTQGGMLHAWLKESRGALWHGEKIIPTPEEEDVYRAIDLPYAEPMERR